MMPNDSEQPDATTAELEQALAFLMRWLEAIQRYRRYPLKRAHYLLLLVLEREGPQPAHRLAEALGLDASTIARQTAMMVEQGLLLKRTDTQDARRYVLEASARGRRQMAAMRAARQERVRALFADFSETDRRRFGSLTRRVNDALARTIERESR